MPEVYILQNQDNLFLGKKRTWLDGRELTALYRTLNKDEAINEMCETNSKDYTQRIHLVPCPIDAKKLPVIDPEIMPEPLPILDDEASMPLDFKADAIRAEQNIEHLTEEQGIEQSTEQELENESNKEQSIGQETLGDNNVLPETEMPINI